MAFSRVAAMRSCFRAARPSIARPQLCRQVVRRTYASGGHETAKAGGDALWAAGAVTVTVPTCWFILSQSPDESHGHDDHGSTHGKGHAEHEEESKNDEPKSEEPELEEPKAEESEKEEPKDEESGDSDSSEKDKEQDTPDTSDDESGRPGENVLAKDDDTNARKHIPDAKGGAKLRIESEKDQKAGEVERQEATSGKHSGAQEGLSNTDTKHSTDITNNSLKGKKGDGIPESAKSKGTVDPKRPQPEKN